MSQGALCAHLAAAEKLLRNALVTRNGDLVQLTPTGHALVLAESIHAASMPTSRPVGDLPDCANAANAPMKTCPDTLLAAAIAEFKAKRPVGD